MFPPTVTAPVILEAPATCTSSNSVRPSTSMFPLKFALPVNVDTPLTFKLVTPIPFAVTSPVKSPVTLPVTAPVTGPINDGEVMIPLTFTLVTSN